MEAQAPHHTLPALLTGADGLTYWAQRHWPAETRGGMLLSPRIDCSSLRLRQSEPGYTADWHVAGDPTLIIVSSGRIRLILRKYEPREFGPGEAFIAADRLPDGVDFDGSLHGHRAEVVSDTTFQAIHIKLTAALG